MFRKFAMLSLLLGLALCVPRLALAGNIEDATEAVIKDIITNTELKLAKAKAGTAEFKELTQQLEMFNNIKRLANFAQKTGLMVEFCVDPVLTLIRTSGSAITEKGIRVVLKKALEANPNTWKRFLPGAVGMLWDLLDPEVTAKDPQEILEDPKATEKEKQTAVAQMMRWDSPNDYHLALILKFMGYSIEPSEYKGKR
jgi:hypothetical protein